MQNTLKHDFFQQRISLFTQQLQLFQKQDNTYSFTRIAFFVTALILMIWFANQRQAVPTAFVFFLTIPIFIFLIKKHQRIIAQRKHFQFLVEINQKEIKRLDNDFGSFANDGSEYFDENHIYTADLDIFGKNSLFQYLNHTATPLGEQKLAKSLSTVENRSNILQKQEAIKELSLKMDFLQHFEAKGKAFKQNALDNEKFWHWIEKEDFLLKNKFLIFAQYLLPMLLLASFIVVAIFDLPLFPIILLILLNIIILSRVNEYIKLTLLEVLPILPTVQAASQLIALIEKEHFSSTRLVDLKTNLTHDTVLISKEINKLSHLISNLEFRQNPYFFAFINVPLLWDLHFLLRLEKWRIKHKLEAKKWFDTVAEIETLNSIACFYILNSEYAFPEIVEDRFLYEAQDLGHPLIPYTKRICNDFSLANTGTIHVITGSNMSGKSTFLRTVGINAVLALMGAPVCAKKMQISVLQIFTSMRTHDSLSESVSSFYAELKRIRLLLDRLNEQPPILFLLDEILKGTNSEDRNRGAKSLIRQLHKSSLSGIVSTHDLELGRLAEENPLYIKNYSFNSELIDNQLFFPYKLSEGVCKSFNASVLMKMIGIEM
ncbi:MAG: DNA mismatch repair protein MutS [Thermoflexibacter sp.]|nr:DNA mismatch repair protein MutS [Thermoflexibacter sp.]